MTYYLIRTKNERTLKLVNDKVQDDRLTESIEKVLSGLMRDIVSFGDIGEELVIKNRDTTILVSSLVWEANDNRLKNVSLEDIDMVMAVEREKYYTGSDGKITKKILVIDVTDKET
jgi:hypothetical protein